MFTDTKCAEIFTNAIIEIAKKPENIENLRDYLSNHFNEWIEKYANTPTYIAIEMQFFADMQI